MADGIRVAEYCALVALGITIDKTKIPLALAESTTGNASVVGDLLAGLRNRGLDVTRPLPVVIDGAKALRRAVTDVFDHPPSTLPAAQAPQRGRPAARHAGLDRRQEAAPDLLPGRSAAGRGRAGGA
jgi:hypothetical protein